MKSIKTKYLLLFLLAFAAHFASAQRKTIEIKYAGFGEKDEEKFPGAQILTRNDAQQIHIFHDGIDMYCDKAIFYGKEDFVEAYGNVKMVQGDTINLNSKYAEYSGKTQLAFASGDVILTEPQSILTTDTLYFNRAKQEAYYKTGGKVVRDSSGTITSKIGRYFMPRKKYRFQDSVKLVNPEYTLKTKILDYYTDTSHAYMYGPSTIEDAASKIYCERGFYDTESDTGYFVKKSRIDYDNRVFEGDSMYFDRNKNFASATNNIKVTDTLNNSIVKGHYAEVYRAKDSVFITKRALAITLQEKDSIFMHADTLMVTGKPEHRITRAYYNAKIYKSDISGKADSVHVDQKTGLTQLINLARMNKGDAFSAARKPILWNVKNQMTGDTIHLKSNPKTEKLDSLIVFYNAFVISKDTLSDDGYNQISGKQLIGLFDDENNLKQVDILKNAESINYSRNENGELIGIEKSKSADIEMYFENKELTELRKLRQFDGKLYTEEDFPANARKLRGFDWREDERPVSVEDLFVDDPPLNLPVIKGLEPYNDEEEFFNDDLIGRVKKADQEAEDKNLIKKDEKPKASRNVPNKFLNKKDSSKEKTGKKLNKIPELKKD
ncbi:OstA-like protein [Mesoflavibacter zeaxanthinifaciens]|uniref:OstA-like protein n=1 Tax=Mesoflavibacter zeaxanthinifaciens TaxID=393060 RepID=UPI0026F197E9|nr:OstA-like protein [Mesoflavibacter zeaxanthinifaciens]